MSEISAADRRVGFAYHCGERHRPRGSRHPEKPERTSVAFERLELAGLLQKCQCLQFTPATDEQLLRCHTATHLARVAAAAHAVAECPDDQALQEPFGDGAIYFSEATERCA